MDKMRGRVGKQFCEVFEQTDRNVFVQNYNAVTILMFYNDSVFSNIHKECETQVAGLAQPYNCRFTLVTVRH
jgi:hypothetical protein